MVADGTKHHLPIMLLSNLNINKLHLILKVAHPTGGFYLLRKTLYRIIARIGSELPDPDASLINGEAE